MPTAAPDKSNRLVVSTNLRPPKPLRTENIEQLYQHSFLLFHFSVQIKGSFRFCVTYRNTRIRNEDLTETNQFFGACFFPG